MTRLVLLCLALTASTSQAAGGMPGHGNLHAVTLKHLEWQGASTYDLELSGWYGDGLKKFVYMVDAHKVGQEDTESELDVGWQRAISPFWDVSLVARYEDGHHSNRTWVGAGLSGTLPYFIHLDSNFMMSEGDALLDIELVHKLPLSQQWSLETKIEMKGITGDESGIEEFAFGLRFGHESLNRLKKYIGVEWQQSPIENTTRTALVAGISYWH